MSGSLLYTMETHDGKDLLETFTNLNIETGNLRENAISAWFDTDSEDDKHLLYWICNLSKCNILSPAEKQERDEILKTNCLISAEDCEKELYEILLHDPLLLKTDDNLLDIKLLENEIEVLQDREATQELLIMKRRYVLYFMLFFVL